jgi:chromosome segregation ATPase
MKQRIIIMTVVLAAWSIEATVLAQSEGSSSPLAGDAQGAVEGQTSAFPTDVAPTVLTPEQEAEAEKLLKEARGVYADILDDSDESKADYLNVNLSYIDERIERSAKELGVKEKELAELNRLVMERRNDIDRSRADDKTKARLRIQLVSEYRNQQESLEFRVGMLKKHIEGLERRKSSIQAELGNLGTAATPTMTEAETAEKELDRVMEQERQNRFNKYR